MSAASVELLHAAEDPSASSSSSSGVESGLEATSSSCEVKPLGVLSHLSRVTLVIGLAFIVLAGGRELFARSRGQAAAAAAMASWSSLDQRRELLQRIIAGGDHTATAMLDRAGRGSISGRQPKPENTALAWAQKRQEREGITQLPSLTKANVSRVVGKNELWGENWMKLEINSALNQQKDAMNQDMAQMAADQMAGQQLISEDGVEFDYFTGMGSLYIDSFECFDVTINEEAGTAVALVLMKAHAMGPLACGGRIGSGMNGGGPYYPFTMQINNFWMQARRIKSDLTLGLPPLLTKAYVGWADTGFGSLDATCYSKTDTGNPPTKVDHSCTDYMNKKLNSERGELIWKMSQLMTQVLQQQFDTQVPMTMQDQNQR